MKVRIFTILAFALCLATIGLSQAIDGVITGRVEDTSGARIPGVTITLTSPAIQGQRTSVTDEGGNYRFPNLSAGTFTVKYELPGFKTLVREGIIVEGGKTVTLNASLVVAALAETVTVTGESPIVDLEQAKIGVNFSSAIKDNMVNARNYWSLLSVTPGIKTTTPDVGGSTMGTQVGYRAYGRSGQVKVRLDGVDLTEGSDSGSMYGDYGSWEEVQVSAAGNSAEMMTGGTAVTAVLRSGGNNFHSTIFLGYEKSGFQVDNIDQNLRNQGITAGDRFTRYTDWNLDLGGPIKRDKLWFYYSFRNEYSGLATEMRKNDGARYTLPASGIAPNLCGSASGQLPCVGDSPDGAPAGGLFYTRLTNPGTLKLTYQINPRNQLSASANIRLKLQPFRGGQGTNARTFTADSTQRQESWFHIFRTQWVSTISSRTTLDVSVNNFGYYWVNNPNIKNSPRIFDRGDTGAIRGYNQGTFIGDVNNNRRWHQDIALSHFFDGLGGSHNLKAGYTMTWEDYRGSTRGYPGHVRYVFENSAPNRIEVFNSPIQWQQNSLLVNSLFLQDRWQLGRKLTLSLGIRFDRFSSFIPEQVRESAQSNPFANAADIRGLESFGNNKWAKQDVAQFNNPVPRFAFVYDVFGNGRTAIKASYNRFSFNPSFDMADQALLNQRRNSVYSWNGTLPFTPAYLRSCLANGTCRILDPAQINRTRIDPNLKNAHIDEYTFGVDQALWGDWNLRFNFVRKIDKDLYGTVDQAYKLTDWAPFQFRDVGRDGLAGTSDDAIITAYNLAVPTRPPDNYLTNVPGAGDMFRTWEIEAIKRMSHRFQIITGGDWTKRDLGPSNYNEGSGRITPYHRSTSAAGSAAGGYITSGVFPSSHYWDWTGKFVLQADLPYGIKYSTVFKSQKGEPSIRTINVNCDRIVNAGQNCAQAGGRAPAQGSYTMPVEQSGSGNNFFPTLTLWDMSVGKQVKMERFGSVEAMFDLFNITNANTVRGWSTTSSTTTNLDGTRVPTFHRPTTILNPRIFRLGLRWRF